MSVELALYQPDIPQNTGTLLRLGACLDVHVHIIHPTGFNFSDKQFRRSAMDYAEYASLQEHNCFDDFNLWRKEHNKRLVLMSTKATISAYEFTYSPQDILLAGRESAGVPENVVKTCESRVRIPMQKQMRSINVSISCAMVIGEAMRQTSGFKDLG